MLVAASGGNERKIADCFAGSASTYDWTPDDSGLLMGLEAKLPGERSSPLRLLDIASGQVEARWTIQFPRGDIDIDPRYSPDGKWIVFRRAISLSDLWKMPAAGGTPQRLTQVKSDIRGWDWLPDGSGLLFSYIGNDIGMFRYDMASGAVTHLKMDGFAVFPDIARNSPCVGIHRRSVDVRYFPPDAAFYSRWESSQGTHISIQPLRHAAGDFADGRTLAFISDRGSRLELWVGEVDKPDSARPVQGIHADSTPCSGLVRGRKQDAGGRQAQRPADALRSRSGKRAHPSAAGAGAQPHLCGLHAGPESLLVGSDSGEGRLRVVLYDRSKTPWREYRACRTWRW